MKTQSKEILTIDITLENATEQCLIFPGRSENHSSQ